MGLEDISMSAFGKKVPQGKKLTFECSDVLADHMRTICGHLKSLDKSVLFSAVRNDAGGPLAYIATIEANTATIDSIIVPILKISSGR